MVVPKFQSFTMKSLVMFPQSKILNLFLTTIETSLHYIKPGITKNETPFWRFLR